LQARPLYGSARGVRDRGPARGNTRERELLKRRIAEAADAASRSLISE
jgi:hypothetical protein